MTQEQPIGAGSPPPADTADPSDTFHLYVPAGWVRVDLNDSASEEAPGLVVNRMVRGAPLSRQPLVRRLLADSLTKPLNDLREQGASTVLLPIDLSDPDPTRPVVALRVLPAADVDPMELVQAIGLNDSSAEIVDIPGLVAVRTTAEVDITTKFLEAAKPWLDESASEGDMPAGLAAAINGIGTPGLVSKRVAYLVGDPTSDSRWLTAHFNSEHPDTDPGLELAMRHISLFDAMMSTLRWSG